VIFFVVIYTAMPYLLISISQISVNCALRFAAARPLSFEVASIWATLAKCFFNIENAQTYFVYVNTSSHPIKMSLVHLHVYLKLDSA